jgi:hypothetical protein
MAGSSWLSLCNHFAQGLRRQLCLARLGQIAGAKDDPHALPLAADERFTVPIAWIETELRTAGGVERPKSK